MKNQLSIQQPHSQYHPAVGDWGTDQDTEEQKADAQKPLSKRRRLKSCTHGPKLGEVPMGEFLWVCVGVYNYIYIYVWNINPLYIEIWNWVPTQIMELYVLFVQIFSGGYCGDVAVYHAITLGTNMNEQQDLMDVV